MTKHSGPNNKITIMIVEDHRMVAESWMMFLNEKNNLQIIAWCRTAEEAIAMARKIEPNVILMDINLPGINGIDATKTICTNCPSIKIIGISLHTNTAYAKRMIQNGASGYLTKSSELVEMLTAIQIVSKGNIYLCKELHSEIVTKSFIDNETESKLALLSAREMQVIQLIKQGLYSREIAATLDITLRTVNAHRSNILKKLRLKNAAELVHFIHENPVVDRRH